MDGGIGVAVSQDFSQQAFRRHRIDPDVLAAVQPCRPALRPPARPERLTHRLPVERGHDPGPTCLAELSSGYLSDPAANLLEVGAELAGDDIGLRGIGQHCVEVTLQIRELNQALVQ